MTTAPTRVHGRRTPHRFSLALIAAIALVTIGALLLVRYDVFRTSSSSTALKGSGIAATQVRTVAAFSGVELGGSNNVTIHVGGRQSVIVHADDNLLSNVTTQVHAGNLVIGNAPGGFTTSSPMSVVVSVPSLSALTLSGSGIISVTGIEASRLTVKLPGSGVLHASGIATRLDVVLAGSGDAQLEQLGARDVRAIVSGSGRILVNPTRSLDASVTGSGAIVYIGNPSRVTTSVTGIGAVTHG